MQNRTFLALLFGVMAFVVGTFAIDEEHTSGHPSDTATAHWTTVPGNSLPIIPHPTHPVPDFSRTELPAISSRPSHPWPTGPRGIQNPPTNATRHSSGGTQPTVHPADETTKHGSHPPHPTHGQGHRTHASRPAHGNHTANWPMTQQRSMTKPLPSFTKVTVSRNPHNSTMIGHPRPTAIAPLQDRDLNSLSAEKFKCDATDKLMSYKSGRCSGRWVYACCPPGYQSYFGEDCQGLPSCKKTASGDKRKWLGVSPNGAVSCADGYAALSHWYGVCMEEPLPDTYTSGKCTGFAGGLC